MPVLHEYEDTSGVYIKSNIDGSFITLQVTPKAARFYQDTLEYGEGDDISWELIQPLLEDKLVYTGGSGPSDPEPTPVDIENSPEITPEERHQLKEFIRPDPVSDQAIRLFTELSKRASNQTAARKRLESITPRHAVNDNFLAVCMQHPIILDRVEIEDGHLVYYSATAGVEWRAHDVRLTADGHDWEFIIRPDDDRRRQRFCISRFGVRKWESTQGSLTQSQVTDFLTVLPDLCWFCGRLPTFNIHPGRWDPPDKTEGIAAEQTGFVEDFLGSIATHHQHGRPTQETLQGIVVRSPDEYTGPGRIQLGNRAVAPIATDAHSEGLSVGDVVTTELRNQSGTVVATNIQIVDSTPDTPETEYIELTDRAGRTHRFPKIENRHPAGERYRFIEQLYRRWGPEIGEADVSSAVRHPDDDAFPNSDIGQTDQDPEPSLGAAASPRAYYYRTIASHGTGENGYVAKEAYDEAFDVSIEAYRANFPTAIDPDDMSTAYVTVEEATRPWEDLQVPPEWIEKYSDTGGVPPLRRPGEALPAEIATRLQEWCEPVDSPSDGVAPPVEDFTREYDSLTDVPGIIPSVSDMARHEWSVSEILMDRSHRAPVYSLEAPSGEMWCRDERFAETGRDLRIWTSVNDDDAMPGHMEDGFWFVFDVADTMVVTWAVMGGSQTPHTSEPTDLSELEEPLLHSAFQGAPAAVSRVQTFVEQHPHTSLAAARDVLTEQPVEGAVPLETEYDITISDHWQQKYAAADSTMQNRLDNFVAKVEENMEHSGFNWSGAGGRYEYGRINDQYRAIINRNRSDRTVTLVDFGGHDLPKQYGCYR